MSASRFLAFLFLSIAAHASNVYGLVTNGGFETTTNSTGQLGFNTNATGWTNLYEAGTTYGYNFLFASGSADTTGATGNAGNLKLWGPGDGSANGLPASSPDGGYYIANDGAYDVAAVQQNITGLTAGSKYVVGFWWAGAQQSGFDGATTDQWAVSLGSQTLDTTVVSLPDKGFSGWQYTRFTFTADAASDVLSFLAIGTPSGEPPFALLDGVSMFAAPEPGTFALIGLALVAIPITARLRRRRSLESQK